MLALQAAAEAQQGCLGFAFAEHVGDPGHYLLVQRWSDQGSLDAHFASKAFADYQQAITLLVVRETVFEVFNVASVLRGVPSEELDLRQDD